MWIYEDSLSCSQVEQWNIFLQTPVYGRREETDTVNDETFGSLEASNKERADEERKRRGESKSPNTAEAC